MHQLLRMSGILLHPTSLPSPYGIGDLGPEARRFIDFLVDSGQHLWQLLPLTHTGFGDSPYQSFSAFAGQPLLISPDHLKELGLITDELLAGAPSGDLEHVDYSAVIPWKYSLLKSAYEQLLTQPSDALFQDFDQIGSQTFNIDAFFVQQADFLQQRLSLMLEDPLKHLDLLTHGRDPVNFIHMRGSDVILRIRNALIHDAQGIAHSAVSQLSD